MEKMSLKKGIICILILLCGFPLHPADGQQACRTLNPVQVESRSRHYRQAYLEMADMLDGKIPLSIKRAVFLAEWAYLDGDLDYDAYCYGAAVAGKSHVCSTQFATNCSPSTDRAWSSGRS